MKSQLVPSARQSTAHWKCTLAHLLCARRSGRKDDEQEPVPVPCGSQGSNGSLDWLCSSGASRWENQAGVAPSCGCTGLVPTGRSGNLRKPRQRGDELQPCIYTGITATVGFPRGSDSTASACNAGDLGSIPGLGRSPGEGNGNPLQYSCLENPMHRRAW